MENPSTFKEPAVHDDGELYLDLKKESRVKEIFHYMSKSPTAMFGLILLAILVLLSVFSPLIMPYGYEEIDVKNAFARPSLEHLCGTDNLGRDIFSRILYGGRFSLTVGIGSVALGAAVGIFFGSLAGFFGGKVDAIIMRLCDVFQGMPGMVINVAMSVALGTGMINTIIALAVGTFTGYLRMARASILSVRELEYIDAARALNCSNAQIIMGHVLPNSISPLIVQISGAIGRSIMASAGLSYLGLGVQPPTPEWGAMLADGRSYLMKYPFLCLFPGLFIMLTVLSLNLLGDGLRDALDPKLKK